MVAQEVMQKIKLVKGEFTPSEACDVVESLIQAKVNFHKVQRLSMEIHDEFCDKSYLNGRIGELLDEKKIAREFIKMAKREGKNITISGTLEISFDD